MATLTWRFGALVLSAGLLSSGAWAAGGSGAAPKGSPSGAGKVPTPEPDMPSAVDLAPLIKEGTPGDLLMQDLLVPSWEANVELSSSSGSLQKSISDQIALPVIGSSYPGNIVQFRGLGKSSEETDVQALGIPLNPGQGGGFDLSIFPQFIWSSYEYQPGPALGTFDPRGTAGSLVLVPWTVQALGAGVGSVRAAALGSSANLFQVSAGVSDGHSMAAIVGTSAGAAQGPSAAFSAHWQVSADQTLAFHLLTTDIDSKVPGPGGYTPFARQSTVRGIPLLQLDSKIGTQGLLKTSVFVDYQNLNYTDPTAGTIPGTQDDVLEVGTVDAFLWEDWTFGVGLKNVDYTPNLLQKESELIFDAMASRTLEPAPGWMIEPTARVILISKYTIAPEGSLGARFSINDQASLFARAGVAKNFPSMLNRFYSLPGASGFRGFSGNPDLQPETDWSATLGAEWKGRKASASLQIYGQLAQDAQVRTPYVFATDDTIINSGTAQILSVLGRVQVSPISLLDVALSGTLNASRLTAFNLPYSLLPGQLGVLSVAVHTPGELKGGGHEWEGIAYARVASSSVGDTQGTPLVAYHEENLEGRARLDGGWQIVGRLEDVLNTKPVLVSGYPSFGRALSVLVSKAL